VGLSGLNRPTGWFFFQRNGDIRVGGEADLVIFDASHETRLNIMMMPFVLSEAVALLEFDAVAVDTIDGADMDAIRTDDLHIFSDLVLHRSFLIATGSNMQHRDGVPEMIETTVVAISLFQSQSGRPSGFFFLEGNGNISIRTEPDLLALNTLHEIDRDVVVMPPVRPMAAITLFQLDAVAFDAVDCTDMNAVEPHDFHVFLILSFIICVFVFEGIDMSVSGSARE
jgi:hypothetical protein